jgi:hypothetical protein
MSVLRIRDYNTAMRRAALFTLLASSVLLAATVQAQLAGGAMRGGGARGGGVSGVRSGLRGGAGGNAHGHHFHNHFGNNFGNNLGNNLGNNAILYPLWDDEPFDYEDSREEPAAPEGFVPPPMMARGGPSRRAPARIPASPKITELPGEADKDASKPLPPALFILTNGERIEARQYLVTYDSVHLTVDRRQRSIPLAMLDLHATLAADRRRGIDLRIPDSQSEISLGF